MFVGLGAGDRRLSAGDHRLSLFVDSSLLDPRGTWADAEEYDAKARELAAMFRENFTRFGDVDASIAAAGPSG